jgi:hypothetical protein
VRMAARGHPGYPDDVTAELLSAGELENSEVSPPADRPVRIKMSARGPYHYRRPARAKVPSSGQVESCNVSAAADRPVRIKVSARGRPGYRCDQDVDERFTRWTKEKTIAFVSTYSCQFDVI